uniref:Uncharacterized protein n=1 Tax=Sphaerodactylus townsendi TaxID=933632 RepID=A0ACB8ER29_9SAUR
MTPKKTNLELLRVEGQASQGWARIRSSCHSSAGGGAFSDPPIHSGSSKSVLSHPTSRFNFPSRSTASQLLPSHPPLVVSPLMVPPMTPCLAPPVADGWLGHYTPVPASVQLFMGLAAGNTSQTGESPFLYFGQFNNPDLVLGPTAVGSVQQGPPYGVSSNGNFMQGLSNTLMHLSQCIGGRTTPGSFSPLSVLPPLGW